MKTIFSLVKITFKVKNILMLGHETLSVDTIKNDLREFILFLRNVKLVLDHRFKK